MKEKSKRNKTLDITEQEGATYLERVFRFTKDKTLSVEEIKNKTVLGDSIEFMKALPDECFDLIIADPPYNLYKDFHGYKFAETGLSDYEEYTLSWLSECKRLLKSTGTIYVCCDWKSALVIGNVMAKLFVLRNRITWEREKGRGAKANWKNSMEDIFFATKSDEYTFNLEKVKVLKKVIAPYTQDGKPKDWEQTENGKFRKTCPSNFWDDISVPYWSMPENTAHPTQKPEKLIAKLILASSNENDLIFDPFLGSGTTSVTAKKLKRDYVGVEQNPRYCVWAEKRLETAEENPSIQGYDGKVFLQRNCKR